MQYAVHITAYESSMFLPFPIYIIKDKYSWQCSVSTISPAYIICWTLLHDISMHYLYNYTQLNEKRIIQMPNNTLVSTIQMHVAIMANLSQFIILNELTMMN